LKVAELCYFVREPAAAARWYAGWTGAQPSGPNRVQWGDVELTFHAADAKGAPGPGGQVAYFAVVSFAATKQRLERAGAKLVRGPLERTDGKRMAQFLDPFGNRVGVIGR
jgi:predicted enzyme related to lactoylglutathione lyase